MNLGDTLKRTGIAAGVTAGVGGVVYAGQRLLATRLRHRDDPDADNPLVPAFDEAIRIDCHDAGSLYVISRGVGPPILFSHGVTLSSRTWAKQFDSIPAAGFRALAFDGRGHGESTVGDTGHSIDNLAADVRSVLEDPRSARRRARGAFDGRDGHAGVRHPASRHRPGTRFRARAAVHRRAHGHQRCAPPARTARAGHRRGAERRRDHAPAEPRPADRADGLRRRTAPEPRRSHPSDARRVLARDPARLVARHALARPHAGTAVDHTPDPRDRRHRRCAHAAARLPPDRVLDSRREPGGVPGRRSHAHVRTRRRSRPAHPRLRARSARAKRAMRERPRRRTSDHRRSRRPCRALDRRRHRRHRDRVPTRHHRLGEIRGGAPATRETALLEPGRTVAARRRDRAVGRFRVRARHRRRRDAGAWPSSAAGSPRGVGRCRSCPRRRSSTSSRPAACCPVSRRVAPRSPPRDGRAAPGRSRSGGSAPVAARPSASGAAASTRCPVASVPRARATATSWSARWWW